MSTVRLRRLQADYENLRAFLRGSRGSACIQVQGSPPERYQLEFQIRRPARGGRAIAGGRQSHRGDLPAAFLSPPAAAVPDADAGLSSQHRPARDLHRRPLECGRAAVVDGGADRRDDRLSELQHQEPLERRGGAVGRTNQDKLPLDKTNFMLDDVQTPTDQQNIGQQNGDSPNDPPSDRLPPDPTLIPAAVQRRSAAAKSRSWPRSEPAALSSLPGTAIPMAIPLPPCQRRRPLRSRPRSRYRGRVEYRHPVRPVRLALFCPARRGGEKGAMQEMSSHPVDPGQALPAIILDEASRMDLRGRPEGSEDGLGSPSYISDERPRDADALLVRRHREMLAIACGVIVLSFLLIVRSDDHAAFVFLPGLPIPSTCPSQSIFHVDCPGCGLTRSFIFLAHGDWHNAFLRNRVGWLLAMAVVLQIPYRLIAL